MPVSLIVSLPDLAATEALGVRLAAIARAGDRILLEGPLGAGKTTFARAFLRAAAGDPVMEVPSPTFTLVQIYDTKIGPVFHYDLWRLCGSASLAELDWEDALDGIVLVEWPDRLGKLRPEDALTVVLRLGEGEAREATLVGWDGRIGSFVPSFRSPMHSDGSNIGNALVGPASSSPSWWGVSRPSAHGRLGADGRDTPGHDVTTAGRDGKAPGARDDKVATDHDGKATPGTNGTHT